MFSSLILRRLLIPTSGGCAFTVVHAKKKDPPPPTCDDSRQLVRASELPLYSEDKKCPKCKKPEEVSNELQKPSLLAESISCARKELWCLMEQVRHISKQFVQYYEVAKEHSESTLEFLREESNLVPRVGAIGIGGLTGYVLGMRKGPIRRIVYSTIGATAIAALCYPKEAEEYTQLSFGLAKKYIIISYHFLNGVSRDLTGYQLPPLPPLSSSHLVFGGDGNQVEGVEGSGGVVPSSAHLLPPTAGATHIPMPHEDETMKLVRDQSHLNDKDMYPKRT